MKYEVHWSKLYCASGTEEIEADSPEEAEKIMDEKIGSLSGSMQYLADDNMIDVEEV